jgi:hypothetical protein
VNKIVDYIIKSRRESFCAETETKSRLKLGEKDINNELLYVCFQKEIKNELEKLALEIKARRVC